MQPKFDYNKKYKYSFGQVLELLKQTVTFFKTPKKILLDVAHKPESIKFQKFSDYNKAMKFAKLHARMTGLELIDKPPKIDPSFGANQPAEAGVFIFPDGKFYRTTFYPNDSGMWIVDVIGRAYDLTDLGENLLYKNIGNCAICGKSISYKDELYEWKVKEGFKEYLVSEYTCKKHFKPNDHPSRRIEFSGNITRSKMDTVIASAQNKYIKQKKSQ